MNLHGSQQNELLYVGFNQDYGCFACGTDTGFCIYNCDPFRSTFRREFKNGGIGYVEMLFRCNILALVGGGRNPRYPPNKVMIWDDHQNRCIGELSFRSEVKAVKLRRDKVVVVLEQKIYVYNFADLKLVDHIETLPNPRGLCALCPYSSNTVLVCPGLQRGHARVELYDRKETKMIAAHEANLGCMALNFNGTRLATASEKGTLIRVFDTETGDMLQELRRGADRAEIYSIAFNYNSKWLAVSSDKGTVHIFAIRDQDDPRPATRRLDSGDGSSAAAGGGGGGSAAAGAGGEDGDKNRSSTLGFMKALLPKYFSSEWSFAQFRVPEARTIVAFGQEKNSIIVVSADGSFYKAVFDPVNGKECKKNSHARFIKGADEEEQI